MPSSALSFRASCGCFQPIFMAFMLRRAKEKAAMRIAMLRPRSRLHGVALGLTLVYLFWDSLILRCGDVEQNPGPTDPQVTPKETRQTTLKNRMSSSSSSSSRPASADRTGRKDSAVKDSGQTPPPPPTESPPWLTDIVTKLQAMETNISTLPSLHSKVSDVDSAVRDVSQQFATLQEEMLGLKQEVLNLRKQNEDLSKANASLMDRIDALERKTDDLEGRSKRNNLIFHGVHRLSGETNEDCEGVIREVLTDKLEMGPEVEFDRVHRLNSKPDSPIIARCCSFKGKVAILKQKRKLKGTTIFIGEDFSARVRDIRRRLSPHLKQARDDGRRCAMVFDHLVIDGSKFYLGEHDRLKPSS